MSDNSLLFAQQIVRRALVTAAKEQTQAWNTRHAAHGHPVTIAANLACDEDLALCYIHEPAPTTLDEITARMAELEIQHAAADYGSRGDIANELRKLDRQRRQLARA